MYSLKTTLTRNLIVNMLVVMSGLLIIMYFSMQQIMMDYVLTRLQHDSESLISALHQEKPNKWIINPGQISSVYNRVKSGHYYRASLNNQIITSRSLFDSDFPLSTDSSTSTLSYTAPGPAQEFLLIWYQQVNKNNEVIKVWVAEDINPLKQQLIRNTLFAFLLVLLITSLLLYLQQRTLQKSFVIFESLRLNLSSIRHKQTEKSGINVPVEIMPLVREIEMLVDQLRSRIIRTRNAIGNMAHELKRPLQLLLIQNEGVTKTGQVKPIDDIKNIIERELRRAKISGAKSIGSKTNLNEELPYIIEMMAKIYPKILIKFDHSIEVESLELDQDDMLELIGNLLDNACKFAYQTVRLTLNINKSYFVLIFEDDGHGIDSAQIEKIKLRGIRVDESTEGYGLGLNICNDILDSYNGTIKFSQSTSGGLMVTVKIPLNVTDL